MAIAPTVTYFGRLPTSIVMQSSTQFDGTTAQSAAAVITPGLYTFPVQALGGYYKFHNESVVVESIAYTGAGTLTVKRMFATGAGVVDATATADTLISTKIRLTPGEWLEFVTTGATTPKLVITGRAALGEQEI